MLTWSRKPETGEQPKIYRELDDERIDEVEVASDRTRRESGQPRRGLDEQQRCIDSSYRLTPRPLLFAVKSLPHRFAGRRHHHIRSWYRWQGETHSHRARNSRCRSRRMKSWVVWVSCSPLCRMFKDYPDVLPRHSQPSITTRPSSFRKHGYSTNPRSLRGNVELC